MNLTPAAGRQTQPGPLIPVRRVGLCDHHIHLIPLDSVRYFFAGRAARGRIRFPGYAPEVFRRDRVYLRTRDELYATLVSSLDGLSPFLDSARFRRIHRSIVINLHGIEMVDTTGRNMQLGFRAGDGFIEWVPVSPGRRAELRHSLGFPSRKARVDVRPAPVLVPGLWRQSSAR